MFVKHFETYNKNKLGTCRAWAEKIQYYPSSPWHDEKLGVTAKQIKNFIATQVTTFHRAMGKKDSTGFSQPRRDKYRVYSCCMFQNASRRA
jgi:hypothetical protein